jgi:hypothetical protein
MVELNQVQVSATCDLTVPDCTATELIYKTTVFRCLLTL